MISPAVQDLIQRVYRAGVDPARWPDALEAICRHIDGGNAALSFLDSQNPSCTVSATYGFPPEAMALYAERYMAIDPFVQAGAVLAPPPGFIGLMQNLITEEELQRTPFYVEFGERYGYIGGIIGVVYAEGSMFGVIAVNRRPGRLFGPPEVELFEDLLPHLRTAMIIQRDLLHERRVGEAAVGTLDRLNSAVFICGEHAEVLHANAAARALASEWISDGRVHGYTPGDTLRLRTTVAKTASELAAGRRIDTATFVHERTGARRLVLVTPVQQDSLPTLIRPVVAVILPAMAPPSEAAVEHMRTLYGLSATEARLACLLAAGTPLRHAAETLRLSYETARTYLKRILEKTGAGRQTELIRIVLTSFGPH